MKVAELFPWVGTHNRTPLSKDPFLVMERVFDDFLNNSLITNLSKDYAVKVNEENSFLPKINIEESETEIKVLAELPGVDIKDVDLLIDDEFLTIKGKREHKKEKKEENHSYYESSFGSFERKIALKSAVDSENVEAELKKGILKVVLKKLAPVETGARKIEVKGS